MLFANVNYAVRDYPGLWTLADVHEGYGLFKNIEQGDHTCRLVISLNQRPLNMLRTQKNGITFQQPTILHVLDETFEDLQTALRQLPPSV